MNKKTASNGRFGVMAAVAPQKVQYELAREYPAGSVVGAATTPSRWDVMGKFKRNIVQKLIGTHNKKENLTIYNI